MSEVPVLEDELPMEPLDTDFQEMVPEEIPVETPEEPEQVWETREGRLLGTLIEQLELGEVSVREQMMRVWKKAENYWKDRQYIIWDEFAGDWRTPGEMREIDASLDIDPASYAKIVNIYKAHGEAIISALSAGLPYVRFFPDDADAQDDVFTAKAYSKLAELIQKRNKGQLLFIRALYVLYNFGTVFAYNENRDTTQFGTFKKSIFTDVPVINRNNFCQNCGQMLGSEQFDLPSAPATPPMGQMGEQESFGPPQSPEMSPQMGAETVQPPNGSQVCPNCGVEAPPDFEDYEEIISRQTGVTEEPKSHEAIEVFSALHVKVPHWCASQSQTPYLTLETEEHSAYLKEVYPEAGHKITPTGDDATAERMARRNADYRGETPQELVTFRRSWLRPWAFNHLGSPDDVAFLKEKFPNGVYVSRIEDVVVETVEDRLDDHWTITINPMSDHLHSDALAQSLIPVQDITNELTNLTLETIEFGIPETFYESDALDAEQYKKSEARPGMLYPAKSRPQMGLDSSFHTIKASALSQEVDTFADRMTQAGQFVSGAFPTIWGGAMEGGGGTAKEYESARAMALQRLNLSWINIKTWWAELMGKSVRSFAANMKDDERYVQKKGSSFINVWIKRAEMNGRVGQVEADINEAFPISWAQKRDILMNLISMKNPMVETVMMHPENSGIIASTVGFPDLYIPGDDDRNKQLYEISQLIMAQPTPTGIQGPDGQEVLQPTIPIAMWENHGVEAETCKAWLKSEVGLDAKETNPAGYMNVVSHMQMHDYQVQMAAQAEAEAESGEKPGDKKPPSNEGGE
jgi:hypothetical protein